MEAQGVSSLPSSFSLLTELAFQLLQKKANLILWDLREEDLDTAREDLTSVHKEGIVITQVVDVTNDSSVEEALRELSRFLFLLACSFFSNDFHALFFDVDIHDTRK